MPIALCRCCFHQLPGWSMLCPLMSKLVRLVNMGVKRDRRWILRGVNWELECGTLNAVIGPNGSGKSTLARVLSGQLWPTEGESLYSDGSEVLSATEIRNRARVVQPAAPLDFDPNTPVRKIILTGFFGTLSLYDTPTAAMRRRAARMIGAVGLERVADSPYGLLSTGEKVRTQIARAVAIRPGLLILDEPTNGLDLLAREQVLSTIGRLILHSRQTTTLMITHHVEELPPQTAQVMILARGRMLCSGIPGEILRAEVLSRAYGVKVEVHHRHGRYYTTVHPQAWAKLI